MSFVISPHWGTTGANWTITIASGEVGSNLTNYPVYLRLSDMPPEFWAAVDADGGNIRVKQGGSLVPIDIISIDTGADTGHMFFLASTLNSGSDNVFTLDLSGGALLANDDANGRNAVWAAYDWVCMCESNSTFTDRTGGANGTLSTGTMGTNSEIALGAGGGIDVDAERIDFTGRPNRTVFTLGVTGNSDIANGAFTRNHHILGYRNEASGATNNVTTIFIEDATTDSWDVWDHLNGSLAVPASGWGIAAGTSYRLHAQYDGTTARHFYRNGQHAITDNTISANTDWDTYTLGMEDPSDALPFDGKIAFAYSRPEVLSADYLAAEYSNLNAPSSFYTVS
jgi:hypothetical protein